MSSFIIQHHIEIYAFDAGNFDSPDYKFFDPENEQFKKNFPNGFSKVAERARELGIKLGYWCGPDGFGETEEDAKAAIEGMKTATENPFNFGA